MKNSQFEAKTFGVGELIMQRKLFLVPSHQRSFAWGKDAVEQFLEDIDAARTNGAADYFVGLIVIQSSSEGEWILLDGQQRLSTVSLIYSAIRSWFSVAGFTEDAKQINHDYMGVRRLGGDYSSRMVLNDENKKYFEIATAVHSTDKNLGELAKGMGKKSSNRLLLEAAIAARNMVNLLGGECSSGNTDGAKNLYSLARFLDAKLKVVAVEVSSEVDAYVLFEALNDRGVALSALDLVKNYIFSKYPDGQEVWDRLIASLGEADPEDFLKVFWTSRFGNIQKSQIFRGIKERYGDPILTKSLLKEMNSDALLLSAIYQDDHPYWSVNDGAIRDQLYLMRFLDSKQARPVLISILRAIRDPALVVQMIGLLAVALFRFQVVAKGRTGVVEKVVGRLCAGVSNGAISTFESFNKTIAELITPDSEFCGQFVSYADLKYSRIAYILAEDAVYSNTQKKGGGKPAVDRVGVVRSVVENTRLTRIYTKEVPCFNGDGVDVYGLVGNYRLEQTGEKHIVPLNGIPTGKNIDPAKHVVLRTREIALRAQKIWSPDYWVN